MAHDPQDLSLAAEPTREVTFEQAVAQIRFSLDELSTLNAHHRFEDLCRQFARARIAPNILPATGPVGAGGDRGRDFETFRSFMREELGPHGGFAGARNSGRCLAFLCTLQRDGIRAKVLADVAAIAGSGTDVEAVFGFIVVPLAKSKRDDLQDEVKRRHALHLEIFDRGALAEALVDREVFWIAEEYLSIPAALRPNWPSDGPALPDWYESDRERWRGRGAVRPQMGELLDVTDGLRFAARNPEARADLPFWLNLVRALDRDDVPEKVRQRSRYEFASAHARGLGDLRPAEEPAIAYLRDALDEDDPSRLDDAASLLAYASAAVWYGLSDLDPADLSRLDTDLRARIRELLEDAPRTRRARLLEVLGRVAIMPDPLAVTPGSIPVPGHALAAALDAATTEHLTEEVAALSSVDISEAIAAWRELASLLEETPLYPVGQFAQILEFFAPLLLQHDAWRDIEHAVDEAVERVEGGAAAAERARMRALRLIDTDQMLPALAELQRAILRYWSGDNLRPALLLMLAVSDVYKRLELPQAAKQYALAAATGAYSHSDDSVTDLVPHAVIRAAHVDYHCGRWLSALQYLDVGLVAQGALVDAEVGEWVARDTQDAVMTVGMALRAAEQIAPDLVPWVRELADKHRMLTELDAVLKEAPEWDKAEWARLADEQLHGRPFSDVGREVDFRFRALGTSWTICSHADYDSHRAAERLAAGAQILLAELATDDLCLLPAEITVDVAVEDTPPDERVKRDFRASTWSFRVALAPRRHPINEQDHFTETLSTLIMILSAVSALPSREALNTVTAAFERGLGHKLALGRPFEEMAYLVPESRYELDLRRSTVRPLADDAPPPPEHAELAWQDAPGPNYSEHQALETIRNRYHRLPSLVPHTLARLRDDPRFTATRVALRKRGWRDWHVLSAVTNIVANGRLAREGLNTMGALATTAARERAHDLMWAAERETDPALPIDRFDVDGMEAARRGAIMAYAQTWDLSLDGGLPNLDALERLLAVRYRYWADDIEHPALFDE